MIQYFSQDFLFNVSKSDLGKVVSISFSLDFMSGVIKRYFRDISALLILVWALFQDDQMQIRTLRSSYFSFIRSYNLKLNLGRLTGITCASVFVLEMLDQFGKNEVSLLLVFNLREVSLLLTQFWVAKDSFEFYISNYFHFVNF